MMTTIKYVLFFNNSLKCISNYLKLNFLNLKLFKITLYYT